MSYYFICDYCNYEVSVRPYEDQNFEKECQHCGQDICVFCAYTSSSNERICDTCFDKEQENELDKESEEAHTT